MVLQDIDSNSRLVVALVLLCICIAGLVTLFFLRPTPWASNHDSAASNPPLEVFKSSFRLLATPQMLLLIVTFVYSGLMLTFCSGVYGTSIGFTQSFGTNAKSLVGLHGIVSGAGHIIGSMTSVLLGRVTR